ncbi:MAG: DUF72 domain-containing protein [Myxococcales bacterium]|nr:DUF72 domain-containing protein [Myxococcales bacterium]
MTLHVGTANFDQPRDRYKARLHFVELELRSPLPAPKRLQKLRADVGEDFVLAAIAPATLFGDEEFPLRDAAHTRAEVDRLQNAVKALAPDVLVFRTPRALRPGTAALERWMTLCRDRLCKMARVVVWEPTGVWEREAALEVTADIENLIVCADPLRDDVSGESHVYVRLRGLGVDSRYNDGKLEDIAEKLAECEEAWVVFATPTAFKEATRLAAIAEGQLTPAYSSADEEDEDEDEEDDGDEDGDEDLEDGDEDLEDGDEEEDFDGDEDDEGDGDEDVEDDGEDEG